MVEAMPMETLVELVNGWGTDPRREDGRTGQPYPPAAQIEEPLGVRIGDEGLAGIADRLHQVFTTSDSAERALLVTGMLTETGVRPELHADGGLLHAGWRVEGDRDTVLAAAAVALRDYLAQHDSHRLGMCADRRCADVYVDTSPGGRRRFCSVTCQNRTRVAAFRSRRSAAG